MMRSAILIPLLALAGCAATSGGTPHGQSSADTETLREIRGYAMASCLAYQPDPVLQRQGYGWASAVMQRMDGGIEVLAGVAEQVRLTGANMPPPAIRDETAPRQDLQLSILHCYGVAHTPAVETAVRDAARAYGRRKQK